MEDFLNEGSSRKRKTSAQRSGYRRVFVLVFAVAVLWQMVSFLQQQISQYHGRLVQDFKVVLPVVAPQDNEALTALGESLSTKTDIVSVKLFSPQDGLAVLQAKNPRLTQALVTLGREQMPAYFELRLNDKAINNVQSFVQNIAAEYPQLSVKYSAELASMIYYSGLCVRMINMAAVFALVLFVIFMFMVEAYPTSGKSTILPTVGVGLVAGLLSFGLLTVVLYPVGELVEPLKQFTTAGRQGAIMGFCGLWAWTLGKWKKF